MLILDKSIDKTNGVPVNSDFKLGKNSWLQEFRHVLHYRHLFFTSQNIHYIWKNNDGFFTDWRYVAIRLNNSLHIEMTVYTMNKILFFRFISLLIISGCSSDDDVSRKTDDAF
jgi:hypothetical protein